MKRITAQVCALAFIICMVPIQVLAASQIPTEILWMKEIDNNVVLLYDTVSEELPDEFVYIVTREGQLIWEGNSLLNGTGQKQCSLDIQTDQFTRQLYEVTIWAVKNDKNKEKSSDMYSFKLTFGSKTSVTASKPTTASPRAMCVNTPYAYVYSSDGNSSTIVAYLKKDDAVKVYGDDKQPMVYITSGKVSGYVYLKNLSSDIFGGSSIGKMVVDVAMTRVGDPYSQALAGIGSYLDCSYLALWTYSHFGVELPRTAAEQARYLTENGKVVAYDEMQPGDLIFWSFVTNNGRYKNISHVGIYTGEGMQVEAANSRVGVRYGQVYEKDKIIVCARPY